MFETLIDDYSTVHGAAQIYRGVVLKHSHIGENCIVGDFSRLYNSTLNKFARTDRSNFINESCVGECSYTGSNDVIMYSNIGKFCSISWSVTIGPGEHNYNLLSTHDFLYNKFYGICGGGEYTYDKNLTRCEIGNDVWIGSNSTILRGIKIGDGAVIGANSLVNKNVPPYAIVAGNPARIIKYRFSPEVIAELLKIEWWNLPLDVIKRNFEIFKEPDINKVIDSLKQL